MLSVREKFQRLKNAPPSPEQLKRLEQYRKQDRNTLIFFMYIMFVPVLIALCKALAVIERSTALLLISVYIISAFIAYVYIVWSIMNWRKRYE